MTKTSVLRKTEKMMFKRDKYLKQLIEKDGNGLIKVITGIRRSGKSYLLNSIFYDYLINEKKIEENHIIKFAFDVEEDIALLDKYLPDQPTVKNINGQGVINDRKFLLYIKEKITDNKKYYLLFDEIQNLENFVRVLNGFLRYEYLDVYVTGSNSNLLSSEIDTEFSGRASRIHLLPLTFAEYLTGTNLDKDSALDEYMWYGGIPLVQSQSNDEEKISQANSIYNDTYLSDVKKRHPKANENNLDQTLKVIASMISTPINPTRIEKTFNGKYGISLANNTIEDYISWFQDAFLIKKAFRFNVKGRSYIGTPYKIYFEDIGIRNAILNLREIDKTDLIENIVFNELRYRGFNVDVGVVTIKKKTGRFDRNGKEIYSDVDTEVDFVANKGNKTYYVQVALQIDTPEKKNQEYESIRHIEDSFKKVIVVKNEGKHYYTNEGFLRISLIDFLTNVDSLDW